MDGFDNMAEYKGLLHLFLACLIVGLAFVIRYWAFFRKKKSDKGEENEL